MDLNFTPYKEFRLNAVMENFDPVIDGFLNRKEFMLLHATAKTGKSMLALNMGLAISTGRDFLGMETTKSKVLYLQTEIANFALKDRVDQMLDGCSEEFYNDAYSNLLISTDRIRIDEAEGVEGIKKKIIELQPNLLIIDPLYDLHRKNEDNATEMAPLLCNFREIARTCDCAIVLIHHQGKKGEAANGNAGHACRGSSAFADVPDISISLSKDKNGFYLKGICRNRPSIEDLRIKFDNSTLRFELDGFVSKIPKTRDLIIDLLEMHQDGLTKQEISKNIQSKITITNSAIQKQLETLKELGVIVQDGTFKNAKYLLKNRKEELVLLEEKSPPSISQPSDSSERINA